MSYAERVKQLRVGRAWSQEQLADVAGINVRTIQRIESGASVAFETLKAIANAFEIDVSELLARPPAQPSKSNGAPSQGQPVTFLSRIRTGRDLFKIVCSAHMFAFEHDELQEHQINLVASFLQDLRDYSDIWDDLKPADHVRVPHSFTQRLAKLEEVGLWVFAGTERRPFRIETAYGAEIVKWKAATVVITNSTNHAIVRLDRDVDAVLPVVLAAG